jgi:hypothetical protein
MPVSVRDLERMLLDLKIAEACMNEAKYKVKKTVEFVQAQLDEVSYMPCYREHCAARDFAGKDQDTNHCANAVCESRME